MNTHSPAPDLASRAHRRVSAVLAVAALALAVSAPALAQTSGTRKKEELRPPVPPASTTSSPPTIPLLVGIALAAMVFGVAFIPSKRGHQD
ncbi:MAG: hypothetical protein ACK4WH_04000 [Phycisphaerales bacterium]